VKHKLVRVKTRYFCRLEPFLVLEKSDHAETDYEHDCLDTGITISPMQLGHVLEVHSINADEESERYEMVETAGPDQIRRDPASPE
jgi:hypothetical protein